MTGVTLRLEIVSAEAEIFSGATEMVFVTGELGELGITTGHSPLVTSLKPGNIRALLPDKKEEVFYVSSGMLEVQPFAVTVLADTVLRAHEIDESAALAAKERAEKMLQDKMSDIDLARASSELAQAIAQLQAIRNLKKKHLKTT